MTPDEFLALTGDHPAAAAFLARTDHYLRNAAHDPEPSTVAIPMQRIQAHLGALTVGPPPAPDGPRHRAHPGHATLTAGHGWDPTGPQTVTR